MNDPKSPDVPRAASNLLLAALRAKLLLLWTAFVYGAFLLRRCSIRHPAGRRAIVPDWMRFWARTTCRILGLKVAARGVPPPRGALLCPNHLGYADILALASVVECFFVSRADAASWPLVGPLLRSSEQILVSRRRDRGLASTSQQIALRLDAGQSVCVFLEGTSTGGDRVLPFLPALVQPAIDSRAPVVPMALRWASTRPGVLVAEDLAYWKDHRFVSHLWRLMGLRGIQAEIVFGQPLSAAGSRKELAATVREKVLELWRGG